MSYRRSDSRRSSRRPINKKYEEEALVLDVITPEMNRRKGKYSGEVILQLIGTSWFTLLEVIPEDHNMIMLQDKITLGKDERSNVKTIIGRITHEELTPVAEFQIPIAIDKILDEQETRFVSWLNKAGSISLRLHSLRLIKGIGPKFLETILEERKVVPFTSYQDFEERTGVSDIKGLLKQRIMEEITTPDLKHHLFTRSIPKERR